MADESQLLIVTSSFPFYDQQSLVSVLFVIANSPFPPPSAPSHPEPGWSPEAEEAIQSLEKQLRSEPRFQRALQDTILPRGATAQLTCLVDGSDSIVMHFVK